jgi:hypothetical protein
MNIHLEVKGSHKSSNSSEPSTFLATAGNPLDEANINASSHILEGS